MDDHTDSHEAPLNERAAEVMRQLVSIVHQIEDSLRGNVEKATRAQLKAVNTSVRQLTNQGFPVPDELRHLKITLLKKESVVEEVVSLRKQLVSELKELLQTLEPDRSVTQSATKPKSRKGKKAGDDKILDLFAWKAEGQ